MFQLSDRRRRMSLRPLSNGNDKYLAVEEERKSPFKLQVMKNIFTKS